MAKQNKSRLKVVLDDSLFKFYHDFRSTGMVAAADQYKLERLLRYAHVGILCNLRQYEACGINIEANLKSQLAHKGEKSQTVEELAQTHKDSYRIILTVDKPDVHKPFPYINIFDEKVDLESCYAGSYDIAQTRDFAIAHIAGLCQKAETLIIYDKYISEKPGNIGLLKKILPHRRLTVRHRHLKKNFITELQAEHATWTFQEDKSLEDRHDRYLVIDNRLEIILTSGFDNLAHTHGDFTYIIRAVTPSRFG